MQGQQPSYGSRTQVAYGALEELLRRIAENKTTGPCYLRFDVANGGIRFVRINIDEEFKPVN